MPSMSLRSNPPLAARERQPINTLRGMSDSTGDGLNRKQAKQGPQLKAWFDPVVFIKIGRMVLYEIIVSTLQV